MDAVSLVKLLDWGDLVLSKKGQGEGSELEEVFWIKGHKELWEKEAAQLNWAEEMCNNRVTSESHWIRDAMQNLSAGAHWVKEVELV